MFFCCFDRMRKEGKKDDRVSASDTEHTKFKFLKLRELGLET